MAPSALYTKLLALTNTHATFPSMEAMFAIRAPDATHAWGHKFLVSRNPKLGESMDNATFKAHLISTGPYISSGRGEVHAITVDEHQRTSVIHMSYFLQAAGSEETVEQDLIWLLKFTDDEDVDKVLIKESLEFIDAAASARISEIIRGVHGEVAENVRGGITLRGY